MPYNNNSYLPPTIDELLAVVVDKWNKEFNTRYDSITFKGTNAYRFAYVFIQTQVQLQNEEATIYAKLKDYFNSINDKMNAATTTNEGIVRAFKDKGYIASVRDNNEQQNGRLAIAVVTDDIIGDKYKETQENEILNIIKDNSIAGVWTEGTQGGMVALSNGQNLQFKFTPAAKIPTKLQLTIKCAQERRRNVDEEAIKKKLLSNLDTRYGLGQDFVPEKYFEITQDAPYAQSVLLEYFNSNILQRLPSASSATASSSSSISSSAATDSIVYTREVYKANFCDLFTFKNEDIKVVFKD